MQTNIFSVKDGSMRTHQDDIRLYSSMHDDNGRSIIASTDINDIVNYGLLKLPSTLIRKPKTDEELAEEKYPYVRGDGSFYQRIREANIEGFLAGRKSVGGEFHLTREQVNEIYRMGFDDRHIDFSNFISSLTLPIYPHTITVEHDGENYLWETIKAEY